MTKMKLEECVKKQWEMMDKILNYLMEQWTPDWDKEGLEEIIRDLQQKRGLYFAFREDD